MAPAAPARFSTTTGCDHASVIFCASTRAMMSVAPPGGNGTMKRTARDGYAWASADADSAIARTKLRIFILALLVSDHYGVLARAARSEERRVGKECRSGRSSYYEITNQ